MRKSKQDTVKQIKKRCFGKICIFNLNFSVQLPVYKAKRKTVSHTNAQYCEQNQ